MKEETIKLYMEGYKNTPHIVGIEILNDSDVMTDYFEEDTVLIHRDSPYYEEASKACKAANIHDAKRAVKWAEKIWRKKSEQDMKNFIGGSWKIDKNALRI